MRGDLPRTISLSDSGKPELPQERFESATEVRSLCRLMISADENGRASMRRRVDALVNGWPTYPKSLTASKGMGWFPRVNYRELEGKIQSQQTPLFDLVTEVKSCIDMKLDIKAPSAGQLADWERKIETHFTWLMFTRWRESFNYHLPISQREMLVHGIGAHVWPSDKWVPRTPRSGQILFPEGASLDWTANGEYFMLRDFTTGVNAYEFIRNEKAAKAKGWLPDNLWKGLAKAQKQNVTLRTFNADELQRRMRRSDLGYWATTQVGLWFNWLFVKEYNGKISLYLVDENFDIEDPKDGGYYFKKRFMFDEWPLVLFPYDVGNGDLHSVVGLGWRAKDFYELSNRINNAMAVQVLLAAFPMFKPTNPGLDPDKLKLGRFGALNIAPYGLEYLQNNFPPLNNSGLALQQHLRDVLNSNNQSLTGDTPEPKDRETAQSFMLRSHDSAKVTNGQQSLYESNLQRWYNKIYRAVINTPRGELEHQKMAEEFRQRCLEDGVPANALTERAIGEIREETSSGAGSAALRLQAIQVVMNSPVYANAPEHKKIEAERSLVAWTMGNTNVDRYARSEQDSQVPSMEESFATTESSTLSMGGDATIGDGQNDEMHADNHLQKAEQMQQMCEQGQLDPQECYKGLQKLLQHAGQHLAKLQTNQFKQAQFKQLVERWKAVAQYLNQLQGEIQSQQGQVPPQQQMSEDAQIKMQQMQSDEAIKNKKADADIARRFRKDALMGRLQDLKTAGQLNLQRQKQTHEQALARQSQRHDQTLEQQDTAHSQALAEVGQEHSMALEKKKASTNGQKAAK